MLTKAVIALLRYAAARTPIRELRPADIRSIAIAELSRLGDVVSTFSAVSHLRLQYPYAKISFFSDHRFAPLINALDIGIKGKGLAGTNSTVGVYSAIKNIRSLRPDLAISISPSKRNAIVTLASNAPFKVGYLTHIDTLTPYLESTAVEGYGFVLNRHVRFTMQNLTDRSINICTALGVSAGSDFEGISIKREILEAVLKSLRDGQLIGERGYVVIHPFSGWEYRNWPLARFGDLADQLTNDVLFLYEQSDEPMMRELKTRFKGSTTVRFFPSGNIVESAVAIQGSVAFVGNDSGPLHLAAALGVRVVGLFGPSSPRLTGPVTPDAVFLYNEVECSPCDQRNCVRPSDPCMRSISTDDVLSAIKTILHAPAESVPHG